MQVGYIRVSTVNQNADRQDYLRDECDKVFEEKQSAKNTDRPELMKMLDYVREGDTIVVHSLDRLCRNTKDLLDIVERLKCKGVQLVSKKENIDTSSVMGKFMLTIFGAVAEMERSNLLERQAEGLAIAKQKGVKLGRPKKTYNRFDEIYTDWFNDKITASEAAKGLSVARSTFYRLVKEYDANIENVK